MYSCTVECILLSKFASEIEEDCVELRVAGFCRGTQDPNGC